MLMSNDLTFGFREDMVDPLLSRQDFSCPVLSDLIFRIELLKFTLTNGSPKNLFNTMVKFTYVRKI